MRTTAARTHSHGMPTGGTARATLEVEVGADPIRGSIDHGAGRQRFWGWLELIEELSRLSVGRPGASSPSTLRDRAPQSQVSAATTTPHHQDRSSTPRANVRRHHDSAAESPPTFGAVSNIQEESR